MQELSNLDFATRLGNGTLKWPPLREWSMEGWRVYVSVDAAGAIYWTTIKLWFRKE